MSSKIKQVINDIQIPKELHKHSKMGISKAKAEMAISKSNRLRIIPTLAIIACVVILIPLGISQMASHPEKPPTHEMTHGSDTSISPADNDENKGEETVRTYLENEFTGPSKELNNILKKEDFEEQVTALNQYIDKKYKDIVAENEYQTFINTNQILRWLTPAYRSGYQLRPKNIELQKADSYSAYTFKVEVEYLKDGTENTTTVTGYINLNKNGRISTIRDVKDRELIQKLLPPPPKGTK